MKTDFTINLGGNKFVFVISRPYGGSSFSVAYDNEVLCDGYQSDGRVYFLSMSKKVELFQEIFEAKVIKSLKRVQKTI